MTPDTIILIILLVGLLPVIWAIVSNNDDL